MMQVALGGEPRRLFKVVWLGSPNIALVNG